MTFKKGVLFIGIISLLLSGCQATRPFETANPRGGLPTGTITVSLLQPVPPKNQLIGQRIFLIALEDAGKSGPAVGCGDSLVAVDVSVGDAPAALQLLLDQHDRYYGQSGLYNALAQSDLTVSRFNVHGEQIEVDLNGKLNLGGVCDAPRLKEQLIATIRQTAGAGNPVAIMVNGVLLDDLLSQK